MPTQPLVKGEAKKKMSLMDYHNRKKSASPVENGASVKTEPKINGTVHAKPLPPKDDVKGQEVKAVEKPNAPRQADAPLEKPRPDLNGERNKTSQPNSRPEPESRKRAADTDNNPSPPKRAKAETNNLKADQPRPPKPGSPRGRAGTADKSSRDIKTETLHPTLNGLPPSSSDKDREMSASPRSTIQVNGSRPRSNSGTPTPRKSETTAKTALPQLLSPLHPSLFGSETEKASTPKKKPTGRISKPEKEKAKKPLQIPALLSPTLPPVIEEILAGKERKQTASKGVSSQASTQSSDSSSAARKTIVAAPPVRAVEEEEDKPARLSKIVTLKLKKANAKRAKDLLSLPSKAAKDALKKERSASAEAAPPPAKKRPPPADDVPQPADSKRTKPTEDAITARPPRPTTPLKPAAPAMSRVTSSQSQGPGSTPAAATGLTPGTSDNRPPTRSEPLDPRTLAQAESYRERHAELQRLGGKLKHARDDLCRDRGPKMTPADERRATALHFEMILAYMVAFDSLNQSRVLERKVCDIAAWESLLPHLNELRNRVQNNKALKALAVQMHVLCLEQITNAFATLDPGAAASTFMRWGKHNRNRALMWGEANALWEKVDGPRLRTVIGPWMGVVDAVAAVLDVMWRWANKEAVRWSPEVSIKGERERERERELDRGRESVRDRERERGRESVPYRERERDSRDRDRDRDRGRDRGRDNRDRERERPRPSLNGSRSRY